MIDVLATLDPAAGIARAVTVARPMPPVDLLWRTIVELDGTRATSDPPSARRVGAYGSSRADCLLRATGEAVERAALNPARGPLPGARWGRRADLGDAALVCHDAALGAPDGGEATLTWYPARRLRDGSAVLVPAGLVDWPHPAPGLFDPSPSGAAAGAGDRMALRHGLLEVIERDALMVAWQRELRLPRIALPAAAGAAKAHTAGAGTAGVLGAVHRLWTAARAAGLRGELAEVPTGLTGVFCAVAVVLDGTGSVFTASVGCKASTDPAGSVLGALQEALQVRALLYYARGDAGAVRSPERIGTEDDRVAHLLSTEAAGQIRDWADGFAAARSLPPASADGSTGVVEGIIEGIVADGGDPLAVDLTPRLPQGLRDMGWAAVKVIPVGYQPLRMDEELSWSWHRPRLAGAEARTGLAGRTGPAPRRPHPLP